MRQAPSSPANRTPGTHAGKYLNVILTVNAALLSALLWTQFAGTEAAAFGQSASAYQSPSMPPETGIPNAGAQRQRQIEELQQLRASVDAMKKTLEGGKMKVIVANTDEIRAAANASGK